VLQPRRSHCSWAPLSGSAFSLWPEANLRNEECRLLGCYAVLLL
jgi:hypothetical protein